MTRYSSPDRRVVPSRRRQEPTRLHAAAHPPAGALPPPFPDAQGGDAEAERLLDDVANARVLHTRLHPELVAQSFDRMPQPCRVVVSGPGEFNTAARTMLADLVDVEEQVTILSA